MAHVSRGQGSCSKCGLRYFNRYKPESCTKCGTHLGGTYIPQSKKPKLMSPKCVRLLSAEGTTYYSCKTHAKDSRCIVAIEDMTDIICLSEKCKNLRATYMNSTNDIVPKFVCEHSQPEVISAAVDPIESYELSEEIINSYPVDDTTKGHLHSLRTNCSFDKCMHKVSASVFCVYGPASSSNSVGFVHLKMGADRGFKCTSADCRGYAAKTKYGKEKKMCIHMHVLLCILRPGTRTTDKAQPVAGPSTAERASTRLPMDLDEREVVFVTEKPAVITHTRIGRYKPLGLKHTLQRQGSFGSDSKPALSDTPHGQNNRDPAILKYSKPLSKPTTTRRPVKLDRHAVNLWSTEEPVQITGYFPYPSIDEQSAGIAGKKTPIQESIFLNDKRTPPQQKNNRPHLPTPSPPPIHQSTRNKDRTAEISENRGECEQQLNGKLNFSSDEFDPKSPDNITHRKSRRLARNDKEKCERVISKTAKIPCRSTDSTFLSSENFVTKSLMFIGALSMVIFICVNINPSGLCVENHFPTDLKGLEDALEANLFGQHLVKRVILAAMKPHISQRKTHSKKPLVMSFHGGIGTGKNFVSAIVAEHLFKDGVNSPFVHKIIVPEHFQHQVGVQTSRAQLRGWINGNVSRCTKRSLFIFDDIDKMPPGVIEVLKPYLDHRGLESNADFRNAIFIFLSSVGAQEINKLALDQYMRGLPRENISLHATERVLGELSTNFNNMWFKTLTGSSLIDYVVPFLPLERIHVKQCITADMRRKALPVHERVVDAVANQLEYSPPGVEVYSTSGCRKIPERVDAVIG